MKTVRNILTIVAVSSFLFACETDQDIYEDENIIEEVKASDVDGAITSDSIDSGGERNR